MKDCAINDVVGVIDGVTRADILRMYKFLDAKRKQGLVVKIYQLVEIENLLQV
jgi:hypothetical protein